MKKIFFVLLLMCFPVQAGAELEVFLSRENLDYSKDIWTGESFPDSGSDSLKIDMHFVREEFPPEYERSNAEIKQLTDTLLNDLGPEQQQSIYESLVSFDSGRLAQYIAISIAPGTQANITDKQSNGFLLTSFESVFQSCSIDLTARRAIARNVLQAIHAGIYSQAEDLRYDDIRFGDCIIPYPDARRGSSNIPDSFESNKLIARTLGGNPLVFPSLEDSVSLFSLSNISTDGTYVGVQNSNLLDLRSTRVEQDEVFAKEIGKDVLLYVHQNHYKNIFKESIVQGNNTSGYLVGGVSFNASHPLSISTSDSEAERTFSGWQEIQEGIYSKTLIQENTYDISGGVYIPKQNVGVTTYYAIVYNYDITQPVCPLTLFSHENAGNENFIVPANPWFGSVKYGYFVCSDDESGCLCDSDTLGCFVKNDSVLSIPQKIPHAGVFQSSFVNKVGVTSLCSSQLENEIYYDTISPDATISLPGIPESSLQREFVNNAGARYDGVEITDKRYYHIENDVSFVADENLDIQLEIYDSYDSSDLSQGVSGLSFYDLTIAKLEDDSWVDMIKKTESFTPYNPLGTLRARDSQTINFQTFDDIENIVTKTGNYQVLLNVYDAANNHARIVLYFEIIPGDINPLNSTLSITQRSEKYADNNDFYVYSVLLKDRYFNPISGREISNIQQSCSGITNCSQLRVDMSGVNPSGPQAIEIFNIDSVSDIDGKVDFSLRSQVPGLFTESFVVTTSNPSDSVRFTLENNTFLSPFVGTLETRVSGNWVGDTLLIDQSAEYRIRVEDLKSLGNIWNSSDFSAQIRARHPDTLFTLSSPLSRLGDSVNFSGIFSSSLSESEKHKTLLEIPQAGQSAVIISYSLGGNTVRYRLSGNVLTPQVLDLTNSGELSNPVKIIGNLQGVGNTHNLSERQNTTDLDTYAFRNTIRKNIGKIDARENNTTLGGVKYIDKSNDTDKNYTLESDPDFETLIVRNGNILISSDFNPSQKKVGIISYIDGGYNKETGFDSLGNIYVESDVTSVNAIMYADGGLISTVSGNTISGDKTSRRDILENQLSIFGSLFTRNTLAGAVESAGNYMLPGGEVSNQENLATQYDLYYLRRGNQGCRRDTYGFCDIQEYMVIEYDPRIHTDPPTFFSQ